LNRPQARDGCAYRQKADHQRRSARSDSRSAQDFAARRKYRAARHAAVGTRDAEARFEPTRRPYRAAEKPGLLLIGVEQKAQGGYAQDQQTAHRQRCAAAADGRV
jgi:hypothetical protein